MKAWLKIHPNDNVLISLKSLKKGTLITEGNDRLSLKQDVPAFHKVALRDLALDAQVVKYGSTIGKTTEVITAGDWVHCHNIRTHLKDQVSYQYSPKLASNSSFAGNTDRAVELYRRGSGTAGIRNELWIIPTVGCVNGIARTLVEQFMAIHPCNDIDGVYAFSHQFGCSQLGDDHQDTRKLLQTMAQHPNAGGVLIIGLGCENNQISEFQKAFDQANQTRIRFLSSQESEDEIEEGLQLIHELYEHMRKDRRVSGKLSEIRFGLECGGSDGLSGITANPLLGMLSDRLTTLGGTTVLTEVPEMFGAEEQLMARAVNETVFHQIVAMIHQFKQYYLSHNQPIYENPSPGNKQGGISTLEEKSIGCTQKSGLSPVTGVVKYGESIVTTGLNLLHAPGNDAIATSALAAAGCQMVLFTTGRGTPYGGFVPTFKLATNSELAKKKKHWIDFDAGQLISEEKSLEIVCDELIDQLARVVSGQPTRNEEQGFRELAIWKHGVTL
ncbi:UxaA family hydrolase [Endozoicomonas numazuensis]|uniref:Altronate hydrolase n=1 Tax=Endozoicomonas numazuensis TaxID=1137799 RepID=A0A081N6A6_9GAMM|nr:altronate dehydratase family protein [Endozoicomonas numazuensis]KEQ13979.1 altronate hydrolase [Endozoicomonas numazuensis]